MLLARRKRLVADLAPVDQVVRGSFFVRRLRCGHADRCRCGRGQLHRAAYLSVTHKGGATEQIAVPRELEPLARAWVQNYARWWDAVERISAINRQLLRRRLVGPTG
jgi:hypothetical protein